MEQEVKCGKWLVLLPQKRKQLNNTAITGEKICTRELAVGSGLAVSEIFDISYYLCSSVTCLMSNNKTAYQLNNLQSCLK